MSSVLCRVCVCVCVHTRMINSLLLPMSIQILEPFIHYPHLSSFGCVEHYVRLTDLLQLDHYDRFSTLFTQKNRATELFHLRTFRAHKNNIQTI